MDIPLLIANQDRRHAGDLRWYKVANLVVNHDALTRVWSATQGDRSLVGEPIWFVDEFQSDDIDDQVDEIFYAIVS
jgi:hypothetical protein